MTTDSVFAFENVFKNKKKEEEKNSISGTNITHKIKNSGNLREKRIITHKIQNFYCSLYLIVSSFLFSKLFS